MEMSTIIKNARSAYAGRCSLVMFDDDTAIVGTVAMYGGLWAFPVGAMDDYFLLHSGKKRCAAIIGSV